MESIINIRKLRKKEKQNKKDSKRKSSVSTSKKNKERSRENSMEKEKLIKNKIKENDKLNNIEIEIEKKLNNLCPNNESKIITVIEPNSSVLNEYRNLNENYIKNLNDKEKKNIYEIIKNNIIQTEEKKAKELGENLYNSLISLKKSDISVNMPKLPFSQSLSDEKFIDLINESISYCESDKNCAQISDIIKIFTNQEKNIKELFLRPKLIKDIMQNALLSILVNPYEIKQINNNISYLSLKNISYQPLVNLPFTYNNINYDLNKETIIENANSIIPLKCFHKNMKTFINNYKLKKEELKDIITKYINEHNFYFVLLKEDLQGITFHTGDIFINLKYIREYFDKDINNNIKIVIREKIILIIFHELNHGLTREIDDSKKQNFLKNSKVKGNKSRLTFKSVFKNAKYYLSMNVSGNAFDFIFFNGFYVNQIDICIAELYLNIKKFKTFKNYKEDLEKLLEKLNENETESVFKFRKTLFTNITQCAFSLNRAVTFYSKTKSDSE